MWIFKNAHRIVLFLAIFLAGMFVTVDTSKNANITQVVSFQVTQAQANPSGTNNQKWDNNTTQTKSNTTQTKSDTTQTKSDTKVKDTFDTVIKALNSVLATITIIVSPLIVFAGWLMSPDWVTGDLFGLRNHLYNLWMTVSNILYFVYAIFLIVIAIATIFNSKNYSYKIMLPRLFLAIAIVPFTWFFVQFAISTSTMMTSTILKIPWDLVQNVAKGDENNKTWWDSNIIPKNLTFSNEKTSLQTLDELCQNNDETKCTSPSKIIGTGGGIYSPLLIYGYGIFKIQDAKTLSTNTSTDLVLNILSLANGMIFSTIMMIVFGFLVIILVCILFIRAIKMWMYAIFSPLFSLKILFRDQWKDDTADMFSIKEFLGLVFVPAIIGLALSFGLIVAATISQGISKTMTANQGNCSLTSAEWCLLMSNFAGNANNEIRQKLIPNPQNEKTYTSVTTVTIAGISMNFEGSIDKSNSVTDVQNTGNFIGWFATIIVQMIALIFIWVAFMAATKINKWIRAVVEPFEAFGKRMKDFWKSSIQHVPLPLVGNVYGLGRTMEQIEGSTRARLNNSFAASTVGQHFGVPYQDPKLEARITSSITIISNGENNDIDNRKGAEEIQKNIKDITEHDYYKGNSKALQAKTASFFEELGKNITDKNQAQRIAEVLELHNISDRGAYDAVRNNGFDGLSKYIKNKSSKDKSLQDIYDAIIKAKATSNSPVTPVKTPPASGGGATSTTPPASGGGATSTTPPPAGWGTTTGGTIP